MNGTDAPGVKKLRRNVGEGAEDLQSPNNTGPDTYQESLDHEASEVARRSEDEDQKMFQETCLYIRKLLQEIQQLKVGKPDEWQNEVEERRVQVLMLTLTLRRLSRVQKVRVCNARDKTAEAKTSVDDVTLQLQNLSYEISHLRKEAQRCLEFHSADQEMDLISLQQFYQEAPESISRPKETRGNEHQQRLARLQWELEQRRGQTELFEQLTRDKESVGMMINEQEQKFASLNPRINSILEATKPLQEALQLPADANKEHHRISRLLPSPLYTLWVQARAYGEACDTKFEVEILGDAEAAKKLIQASDNTKMELSDSEDDLDQKEETSGQRGNRSKKEQKMETNKPEIAVDKLTEVHPLSIKATITTKEGSSVTLTFYYLQCLGIITVKCSVRVPKNPRTKVNGEDLLSSLFPGDTGASSPNPATLYQLKQASISQPELFNATGRPYHWAQALGGLNFSKLQQPTESCMEDFSQESGRRWEVSAEHLHITVKAIQNGVLLFSR